MKEDNWNALISEEASIGVNSLSTPLNTEIEREDVILIDEKEPIFNSCSMQEIWSKNIRMNMERRTSLASGKE